MVLRLTNNEVSSNGYYNAYNVFSDISGHWAASNIATGVNLGFLAGYPDGTFRPDADISAEEIQTILIRVLGYEQALSSTVAWPNNVIAQSSQIGLTKYITNIQGQTSRGSAAVFMDNALEIPMMKVTAFSTGINGNYISIDENSAILNKSLGLRKVKGDVTVTSENSSRLRTSQFAMDNTKWYFASDSENSTTFEMADKTSANYLLGRSIVLYCNEDNEVVYFEYSDDYEEGNVFYASIKNFWQLYNSNNQW
jgi:hypothetical protein